MSNLPFFLFIMYPQKQWFTELNQKIATAWPKQVLSRKFVEQFWDIFQRSCAIIAHLWVVCIRRALISIRTSAKYKTSLYYVYLSFLKTLVSKIRSPEKHLRLSFLRRQLTILKEKLCFTKVLINSVQGMTAWLLLIFFICLQNQLSSLHSIIMMFEKCDSSNRQ